MPGPASDTASRARQPVAGATVADETTGHRPRRKSMIAAKSRSLATEGALARTRPARSERLVPAKGRAPAGDATRPRKILVPLDGRRAAEAALPAAIELARTAGSRVYLLHTLAVAAPTVDASVRHQGAERSAGRYLAAVRKRLAAGGVIDVSIAVWSGAPAAAIVKAAELTGADVIVMARSGPTGPPRDLVGSAVERVLRGTRRPVLVIAPPDAAVDEGLGDAAPLPEPAMPDHRPDPHGIPSARGPRVPSPRRS